MASEKNLNAVFTDIANAIRGKKGTTEQFQPINMADEIANLPSGGSFPPDWSEIGYSGTPQGILDGFEYAKKIAREWDDTQTYLFRKFYEDKKLVFFPLVDTSKADNMGWMFYSCSHLMEISDIDTSNATDMSLMFYGCSSLTTIPKLDMSKVKSMDRMFGNCSSIITIPELDVSNVTNLGGMFQYCSSLKSILMTGMKVSFRIADSTQFEESDLVTILNNLATVTSTQTLTMGATNLAKLTDEEKAIATNKGWTLA